MSGVDQELELLGVTEEEVSEAYDQIIKGQTSDDDDKTNAKMAKEDDDDEEGFDVDDKDMSEDEDDDEDDKKDMKKGSKKMKKSGNYKKKADDDDDDDEDYDEDYDGDDDEGDKKDMKKGGKKIKKGFDYEEDEALQEEIDAVPILKSFQNGMNDTRDMVESNRSEMFEANKNMATIMKGMYDEIVGLRSEVSEMKKAQDDLAHTPNPRKSVGVMPVDRFEKGGDAGKVRISVNKARGAEKDFLLKAMDAVAFPNGGDSIDHAEDKEMAKAAAQYELGASPVKDEEIVKLQKAIGDKYELVP